ncbi:hypothetical protein CCACVL1_06261 [Corchorus capsularis]|uniref:Uncharacterized protein n=1 Tax=Corchorus capsularis TaxID=210143 RepID=A0A1R3JGL5_COCAP|nr:hypothetical protein CCACVL1_06261 [Corchorus capsularis]
MAMMETLTQLMKGNGKQEEQNHVSEEQKLAALGIEGEFREKRSKKWFVREGLKIIP